MIRNWITGALIAPTPRNDPKLFLPVKVRCLRPFYVGGKPLKVGDVATVEAYLARDLAAVGKAEIVG